MSIQSSSKFTHVKGLINQVKEEMTLSEDEKNETIEKLVKSELKVTLDLELTNLLAIFACKLAFADEYNRRLTNEIIEVAVNQGKSHYKSLTPCSGKSSGGCGNTIRYVSNRGCTTCQSTATISNDEKSSSAESIINKYPDLSKKAPIVRELMEALSIKKSAAYRLIKLHETGVALYNRSAIAPSYEVDGAMSSADVVKLTTRRAFSDPFSAVKSTGSVDTSNGFIQESGEFDEFDLNQDDSATWEDEWAVA